MSVKCMRDTITVLDWSVNRDSFSVDLKIAVLNCFFLIRGKLSVSHIQFGKAMLTEREEEHT